MSDCFPVNLLMFVHLLKVERNENDLKASIEEKQKVYLQNVSSKRELARGTWNLLQHTNCLDTFDWIRPDVREHVFNPNDTVVGETAARMYEIDNARMWRL